MNVHTLRTSSAIRLKSSRRCAARRGPHRLGQGRRDDRGRPQAGYPRTRTNATSSPTGRARNWSSPGPGSRSICASSPRWSTSSRPAARPHHPHASRPARLRRRPETSPRGAARLICWRARSSAFLDGLPPTLTRRTPPRHQPSPKPPNQAPKRHCQAIALCTNQLLA